MIYRLWDHISNCYARAADARRHAELTNDPERRADLQLLEHHWRDLAQSYELSEQLERALIARDERLERRIDWQRAAVAPFDRDLELATIGAGGIQPVGFACRRILRGWIASQTRQPLNIEPTHWREWMSYAKPKRVKRLAALRRDGSGPILRSVPLPLQSGE